MKEPIKVVMLETSDKTTLHLWTDENGSRPELCELEHSHTRNTQHLYITVSQPIKEGDWVIQTNFEKTNSSLILIENEMQCKYANDTNGSFTKRKIIATTDSELKIDLGHLCLDSLPQVPQSFLKEFVTNPDGEYEVEYIGGRWDYRRLKELKQ